MTTVIRDKLMHTNGTSPYETVAVIVPSFFYTSFTVILVSLLQTFHTQNKILQFCLEFLTLVVPLVLNVTILAEYTMEMLIFSLIAYLSLLILMQNIKIISQNAPEILKEQNFITNARSTIFIISVIAILAVDFQIFPRRFAKTESFGYSLMDVGVGLFIFANGIVDGGKSDLLKSLRGVIPLLILGTARFVVTTKVNYHVPVSEYGVHWNFFITLALIKIFVSLIFSVISIEFIWINASLLLISHEILLQSGLENYVMSNMKRTDFIKANREGLVSGIGYVCLYLLSAYYGHFLNIKKTNSKTTTVLKFVILSVLSLSLSVALTINFGISRKLVNSAYCFWVLFIGIFMTGLFYSAEMAQKYVFKNKLTSYVFSPLIFEAINYNGLTFFLISNLLTGLINILTDTLKTGPEVSLFIICTYMLANCTAVCILFKKKIKLKL